MSRRRLTLSLLLLAFLITPFALWFGLYQADLVAAPGRPFAPPYNLSDRLAKLPIETSSNGTEIVFADGSRMSPDAFIEHLQQRQQTQSSSRWFAILDITSWTSVFWVIIGLGGQILFTGRMLVQWLASEKAQASVVPESFWWMSLFGGAMLITYFIWRIDIVGVLGQSTGLFVYIRNLWFIREQKAST